MGRLSGGLAEGGGVRRYPFHRCDDRTIWTTRRCARASAELQPDRGGLHRDHARRSTWPNGCWRSRRRWCRTRCAFWAGSTRPSCTSRCCREAPWIDVIVRGEGEEIITELMRAIDDGRWPADRRKIKGLAFRRRRRDRGDARRLDGQEPRRDRPGLVASGMGEVHLRPPWACGSRSRTWRGAARSPAPSVRSGNSGATTGCAIRSRSWTRSSGW